MSRIYFLTVRAVNHDGLLLALVGQDLLGGLDALLVVVGALGSTAEDNEAVLITLRASDSSETLLGNTHEVVLGCGSTNGINSDAEISIGSVLEADREGKARGKLSVKL